MVTLTIENYIKTIYQTCAEQQNRPAATGQLAGALQVSPGTVTSMLKTLHESGLVEYTPYEGVRLTDAGLKLALRVLRRHRLIELFLVKTLQLSWDEVHAEAENMEHAVSDHLIDRIDFFLGYPTADPHGDPIPRADGTMDCSADQSLGTWPPGQSFLLVRVLDQSPEFLRYLSQCGLSLGVCGRVLSSPPESGTVSLEINDCRITLARELAEKLLVTRPTPRGEDWEKTGPNE